MSSQDMQCTTAHDVSHKVESHNLRDRRQIMLRVQTDLLIADTVRTPEVISEYETMLMALLNDIDYQTALIIANKIAHITEVSKEMQHALNIRLGYVPDNKNSMCADFKIDNETKNENTAHYAQSIHRSPISAYSNIETDRNLAANQKIILSLSELAILLKRARSDKKTAQSLLQRTDIKTSDKVTLYHLGDKKQRTEIRSNIEQIDREAMRRLALPVLSEEKLERLVENARIRNVEKFNQLLNELTHISLHHIELIRQDITCNLLALAINIAGCSRDQACAIFLSQDEYISHSYERVMTLVSEIENMSRACAMRILSAILERDLLYTTAQLGSPPNIKNKTSKFSSAYIIRNPELPLSLKRN